MENLEHFVQKGRDLLTRKVPLKSALSMLRYQGLPEESVSVLIDLLTPQEETSAAAPPPSPSAGCDTVSEGVSVQRSSENLREKTSNVIDAMIDRAVTSLHAATAAGGSCGA